MSLRHAHRPSSSRSHTGWLARLAPLAALALFGCLADKSPALAEEASTGAETGGEETAGEVTGDPAGDDPQAQLASECAQRFACGCSSDRFTDVAACEEHYEVEWAGIAAKAEAAGLTADLECYLQSMPFATFGCDSYTEHYQDTQDLACSFCQYAYGERQVGEACQDFGGGVGDCAQGLLCYPDAHAVARCIDPCSQAGPGESCNYLACQDGLLCDWVDTTCRAAGGAGEPCADGSCAAGLVCDWQTNLCTTGAGSGEACADGPCATGLACGLDLVCGPPAGPGESCVATPCAEGLVCRWDDSTCAAPAQEGESCLATECAPGLFCDVMLAVCAPPGSSGDPCLDRPCVDGLACDFDAGTCGPIPGLGEPCFDLCADGLLCNYDVAPAVCAAWPVGGEPCVASNCAVNFLCDGEANLCVDEPPALCNL